MVGRMRKARPRLMNGQNGQGPLYLNYWRPRGQALVRVSASYGGPANSPSLERTNFSQKQVQLRNRRQGYERSTATAARPFMSIFNETLSCVCVRFSGCCRLWPMARPCANTLRSWRPGNEDQTPVYDPVINVSQPHCTQCRRSNRKVTASAAKQQRNRRWDRERAAPLPSRAWCWKSPALPQRRPAIEVPGPLEGICTKRGYMRRGGTPRALSLPFPGILY